MTRTLRLSRSAAPFALALGMIAGAAHEQARAQATDARRAPSTIRVQVADSLGVPIADAEVTIMRGLKQVVSTARTDALGEHSFIVDLDSSDYSVVARRVGFARGDRFFAAEKTNQTARVKMKRIEGTLPSVTITAVDLKRKSYHIDSDEIAGAEVLVHDALDIVSRLRPDMILSRSGSAAAHTRIGCPSLSYIWVNGTRFLADYVFADPIVQMRQRGGRANKLSKIAPGNATILSEIEPEHISEMNYHDCFEQPISRMIGSVNALFITLKPGVGYRPGSHSFVTADTVGVAAK